MILFFIAAVVVLVAGFIVMQICGRKKEFKLAGSYGVTASVIAIALLLCGLAMLSGEPTTMGGVRTKNAYMVEMGYVESQNSDGSIEIMSSGHKDALKSRTDAPADGDVVLVLKSVWSGETMYIVLENGE